MESIRAPEVYCLQCDCSFAPETKTCIHCGARLRGMRGIALHENPAAPFPEIEERGQPKRGAAQAVVAILSVAVMAGMALLRACGG